jgi:hypothetical protein
MRSFLVLLVVLAAVAVPAAQAGKPIVSPAPAEDHVDTTCGFAIAVHVTVNGETAKEFSNGKVLITGPLAAQFSANGKSITLNVSGPTTVTPTADGSVTIIGHGVGIGPLFTPNGVTLAYSAGVASIDPAGGPATLVHGHILLDVCAALAP